jgi:hypothetical protein
MGIGKARAEQHPQRTAVDRQLWQLLEELWYTVEHTFLATPVIKMWENSNGAALLQVLQAQLILAPVAPVVPQGP